MKKFAHHTTNTIFISKGHLNHELPINEHPTNLSRPWPSATLITHSWALNTIPKPCHDRDIPPQPSHTCLCLLAVQTPPEHSLTKPEPIPGLSNPSIAFSNSSAAFPKGCCTNVCLVSIPEAVNIIPEHIWPFPTNPKHLESHRPTPSLHAHLWTRRLSMRNCDWAKPEHLAEFPIESYSFSSVLIIIRLSLPLSRSLLSFLSSVNPVSI